MKGRYVELVDSLRTLGAELRRDCRDVAKLFVPPVARIRVEIGGNEHTVPIRSLDDDTANLVKKHIEESFLDRLRDETAARRILWRLKEVDSTAENLPAGRHEYDYIRGITLRFASTAYERTVAHELGHAIASSHGYWLPAGGGVAAEDYDGTIPDVDPTDRRGHLFHHGRLGAAASGPEHGLRRLRTWESRVPGKAAIESQALDATTSIEEQSWRPTGRGDFFLGDYVRVETGDCDHHGRVIATEPVTLRCADGRRRQFDASATVTGCIDGFPPADPGQTPEEKVERLVAAANRAWYRMAAENAVGMTPVVIGTPYSMTTAHETLAKAHEVLHLGKGRRCDSSAPFADEFPELHAAYADLFRCEAAPVAPPTEK